MKYKIALVTNKSLHHKYWVVEMMKHNDVVCVIHPENKDVSSRKLGKLKSMVKSKGWLYTLLYLFTEFYFLFSSNNSRKEFKRESSAFFKDYEGKYDQIDGSLIHEVSSVNSQKAIDLVKKNEVDIVCVLGGDVAKADFINSPRQVCLNYHTGLSPVYNGASSFAWAVAEHRPNLVGATLMKMTPRIDGGHIIAQFMPSIEKKDNAASLFMKTVIGSVALYSEAIKKFEEQQPVPTVKQERSIRYTKVIDWTIYQELQLKAFYKSNKISKYLRDDKAIWANDSNDSLFLKELLLSVLKFN